MGALCANDQDLNALLPLVLVDRYVGGRFIQGVPEKDLALNFVDYVPFLVFGTLNTDLYPFGCIGPFWTLWTPFGHF